MTNAFSKELVELWYPVTRYSYDLLSTSDKKRVDRQLAKMAVKGTLPNNNFDLMSTAQRRVYDQIAASMAAGHPQPIVRLASRFPGEATEEDLQEFYDCEVLPASEQGCSFSRCRAVTSPIRDIFKNAYHIIQPLLSAAFMIYHKHYNAAIAQLTTFVVVEFAGVAINKLYKFYRFFCHLTYFCGLVSNIQDLFSRVKDFIFGIKHETLELDEFFDVDNDLDDYYSSSPKLAKEQGSSDDGSFSTFFELVSGKNGSSESIERAARRFNTLATAIRNVSCGSDRIKYVVESIFGGIYEWATGQYYYPSNFSAVQKNALEIRDHLVEFETGNLEDHEYAQSADCVNRIQRVRLLVEQCRQDLICMDTNSPWAKVVLETCTKADLVIENYKRIVRSSGTRPEPVWLYIRSTPGVGKSFINSIITSSIKEAMYKDTAAVAYAVNLETEYWEGYANHPIVTIDELWNDGRKEKQESLAVTLLQMVSSYPMPLNMAAVESKGNVMFNSRYLITLSNHGLPGVVCKHALERRIWQLFDVTLTDAAPFTTHVVNGQEQRRLNAAEFQAHIKGLDARDVPAYLDTVWRFSCQSRTYTISEVIHGFVTQSIGNSNMTSIKKKAVIPLDFEAVPDFEFEPYVPAPESDGTEAVELKVGKKEYPVTLRQPRTRQYKKKLKVREQGGLLTLGLWGTATASFAIMDALPLEASYVAAGVGTITGLAFVGSLISNIIDFVKSLGQVHYSVTSQHRDKVGYLWMVFNVKGVDYAYRVDGVVGKIPDPAFVESVCGPKIPITIHTLTFPANLDFSKLPSYEFTKSQARMYDEYGNLMSHRDARAALRFERAEQRQDEYYERLIARMTEDAWDQGASAEQLELIVGTHAVTLVGVDGDKMFANQGIIVTGQSVLCTGHFVRWLRLHEDGQIRVFLPANSTATVKVSECMMVADYNRDHGLIKFPRTAFPAFRPITKLFAPPRNDNRQINDFRLHFVDRVLGNSVETQDYKFKRCSDIASSGVGGVHSYIGMYVLDGTPTLDGQCGSIYTAISGLGGMIAGLHIAITGAGEPVMTPINNTQLAELLARSESEIIHDLGLEFRLPDRDVGVGMTQGKIIHDGKELSSSKPRPDYKPSPLHSSVLTVKDKHGVEHRFDKLYKAPFDMSPKLNLYERSNSKVNKPPAKFTADPGLVQRSLRCALIDLALPRDVKRLTIEEALNVGEDNITKPDLKTSSGWYFKAKNLTKKDLVHFDEERRMYLPSDELRERVNHYLELLESGKVLLVAEESIKVELRNVQKDGADCPLVPEADCNFKRYRLAGYSVKQPRTINTMCFAWNLACRMLWGSMISEFIRAHCKSWSAVGMSPNSIDVALMFRKLYADSNEGREILCGDVSGMEFFPRPYMDLMYRSLCEYFKADKLMVNALESHFDTLYVQGSYSYLAYSRNSSGNLFTTFLNTFADAGYHYYAFAKHTGLDPSSLTRFGTLYVYGDDSIAAFSKVGMNNLHLAEYLGHLGVTYTPPAKTNAVQEYTDIWDAIFLSRQFVLCEESGRIGFALPLFKIADICRYQRVRKVEGEDTFPSLLMSANYEAAQYPLRVYEQVWEYLDQAYRKLVHKPLPYVHSEVNTYTIVKHQSGEERLAGKLIEDSSINVEFEDQFQVVHDDDVGVSNLVANRTDPFTEADLQNVLGRNALIQQVDWLASDPSGTILASIDFPKALYATQSFTDHLKRFQYFRSGVRVSVRINTTQFNYGTLMAFWLPASEKPSDEYTWRVTNMFSQCNNDPEFISATVGNTVIIDIPWNSPLLYDDLGHKIDTLIGRFYIAVLNPLRTAQFDPAASIPVMIFAQAVDPKVAGWDEQVTLQSKEVGTGSDYFNAVEARVTGATETAEGVNLSNVSVKSKPNAYKERSNKAKVKANKQIMTAEVRANPSQGNAITGRNFGDTIVDSISAVGSNIASIANSLLNSEAAMGALKTAVLLDKPTQLQAQTSVRQNLVSDVSFVDGTDMSTRCSALPSAALPTDDSVVPQTMRALMEVIRTPSLVGWYEILSNATPNAVLYSVPVTPAIFAQYSEPDKINLVPSYCAWYSQFFRYWRGSMRYKIKFVTSKYTVAKVRITYARVGTAASYAVGDSMFSKVVDINGETDIDLIVPYLSYKPYLDWYPTWPSTGDALQVGCGCLRISAIIAPRSPEGPNGVVYVNVFAAAGPDMTFNVLSPSHVPPAYTISGGTYVFDSINWNQFNVQTVSPKPEGYEEAIEQGLWVDFNNADYTSFGDINLYPEIGYVAPERVDSLNQMLHRYERRDNAPYGGVGTHCLIMRPFWYWRGARRYKYVFDSTTDYWTVSVDDGAFAYNYASTYKNWTFGRAGIWPLGEVEIPWYCDLAYCHCNDDSFTPLDDDVSGNFSVEFEAMGDDIVVGLLRTPPVLTFSNVA